MFTIKGCSLIRGVHYERFHCIRTIFILLLSLSSQRDHSTCRDLFTVTGVRASTFKYIYLVKKLEYST